MAKIKYLSIVQIDKAVAWLVAELLDHDRLPDVIGRFAHAVILQNRIKRTHRRSVERMDMERKVPEQAIPDPVVFVVMAVEEQIDVPFGHLAVGLKHPQRWVNERGRIVLDDDGIPVGI